jgi:hypothetical protein
MIQSISDSRARKLAWTLGAVAAGVGTYWAIRVTREGLPPGVGGITVLYLPIVALLFALQGARPSSSLRRLLWVMVLQLFGMSMGSIYRAASGGRAISPWVATFLISCGLVAGAFVLERLSNVAAQRGVEPDGSSPRGLTP